MVMGDGAAVERGTLVDLLHHHEMKGGSDGCQGRVEIGCVLERSLCGCVRVCVCVCVCVCACASHHTYQSEEPANATADSCFRLFGPCQELTSTS